LTNVVIDPARYPPLPDALLRNSRVVPDRWASLPAWPKQGVIAEIGVGLGGFSEAILQTCQPRKFLAIDRFDLHELETLWGKPPAEHFAGRTHGEFYRDRFAAEIAAGRVEVIEGDSGPVISALADESVDVFYVDADHTYEGVRRDLEAILPKVKPAGWIVMNDYIPAETGFSNEPYGVIQATNEFMVAHGWEMVHFALAAVMYCDVALRRADRPREPHEHDFGALSERAERLQSHVAALEEALAATRRSTSWRITAPLRAIGRAIGRGPSR